MKKSFKPWMKQYLNFSRSDRNAILILSFLILLLIIANVIIDNIQPKSDFDYSEFEKTIEEWEKSKTEVKKGVNFLFDFNPNTISGQKLDSLMIPDFIKRNMLRYRSAGGKFSNPADVRKIYGMNDSIFAIIENYIQVDQNLSFRASAGSNPVKPDLGYFDPNQADINELLKFGFNRFQANNLIEYRKRGAGIKDKSDLLKIYGIDSVFFAAIEKHIQIETIVGQSANDAIVALLVVELNSADSLTLIKLEGIGPVFASRILKYRNLLGGFYSKTQLLEIYNFPQETFTVISNKIVADTVQIRKIRINFANYGEMLRHPYLEKTQVESILNYRGRHGAFLSVNQVLQVGLLDSLTFNKVQPYLSSR